MAQKIENVQKKISLGKKTPTTRPLASVLLFTFGLLWLVALIDYTPKQSIYVTTNPLPNKIGWLGAMLSFWSLYITGALAWILPFLCFFIAYKLFFKQLYPLNRWKWTACLLSILMSCALMTSYQQAFGSRSSWSSNYFSYGWGGIVGDMVFSRGLNPMLGLVGSFLFLIPLNGLGLLLLFCPPNHPREATEWLIAKGRGVKEKFQHSWLKLQKKRAAKDLEASKKTLLSKATPAAKSVVPPPQITEIPQKKHDESPSGAVLDEKLSLRTILQQSQQASSTLSNPTKTDTDKADPLPSKVLEPVAQKASLPHLIEATSDPESNSGPSSTLCNEEPPEKLLLRAKDSQEAVLATSPSSAAIVPPKVSPLPSSSYSHQPLRVIAEEKIEKALLTPHIRGDYQFPPIDLLAEARLENITSLDDHQSTMDNLVITLKQFGIEVTPSEVYAGPVITRYEVVPAPGVRVEKIANLEKNIAMALRALSVRIIAPVPGKGCVGIEIPNTHPEAVCLREIIESRAWADAKAEIPLVLGKEVTGKPLVVDLVKMPHLLIAGATGAGKTVCINAIIASLVYHGSPADIRFLMVDPKIVEMQMYNSLPHMLIPVVTDPKKVPNALKWLMRIRRGREWGNFWGHYGS